MVRYAESRCRYDNHSRGTGSRHRVGVIHASVNTQNASSMSTAPLPEATSLVIYLHIRISVHETHYLVPLPRLET
jgi:hypothetical protein